MKWIPFITALLAIIEIFREHKTFKSQSQPFGTLTIILLILTLTSAFIAFNGQLQADKDTAFYKEKFKTLEKQGQELSNQATGGDGFAYINFFIGYDRNHDPALSEYFIRCDLYTQSKYKLENVTVSLKQKFREYGKEDHMILQTRFPVVKGNQSDTIYGLNKFDPINSVPLFDRAAIRKVDTAFYFKATILQMNYGEIYQTTILKRIREIEKPFESYRWVKAMIVETSSKVLKEEIDPDYPRAADGSVDWRVSWFDPK